MFKAKFRAFLIHLAISAVVVGTVCAVIFLVWYPAPYFTANGTSSVLAVLLGVDLVVGPLLTLYLFRPGKPSLRFDMTVIGVVQLAALIGGTTVIHRERPYFAVFAVDRFEVVALSEVDPGQVPESILDDKPTIGPALVFAALPDDAEGVQELIDSVVMGGQPDIDRQPRYWADYAENASKVIERARGLEALARRDAATAAAVGGFVEHAGKHVAEFGYVPLVGRDASFVFVIDLATGLPVDLLDIDPWQDWS